MNIFKDFIESRRWLHFIYAIPISLIFTIFCALGLAAGMEYKDDYYWGEWDWKDFWWTIIGGLVGQSLQILIIYFIFF